MQYIELHAHSAFSFGAGAVAPEHLAERAAELGYPALALTDTTDLGGAIRFTLEAERVGIKPIVGAELLIDGHPTVLLTRNVLGYRNLASLVTKSRIGAIDRWQKEVEDRAPHRVSTAPLNRARGHNLERRYAVDLPQRGQPRLTFNDLIEHSQGLYCLTGGSNGEFATYVRTGRTTEAVFALERWRDVFGDRLAVEVQLHHVDGREQALASALIELAERSRLKWVATNEPFYLDSGGRLVHDLLMANRADVCVNTAASWGLLLPNGEWRLKSPKEMATLWKGREVGLENSCVIASECASFDLQWLRPPMPRFAVPAGHNDDSYLRELVYRGAVVRWGDVDERQRGQIEHELGVIRRLGFSGFFLVMHDAVDYARRNGILCLGRGSAANSVVAYALGITAVDPVKHGLLFERFLSIESRRNRLNWVAPMSRSTSMRWSIGARRANGEPRGDVRSSDKASTAMCHGGRATIHQRSRAKLLARLNSDGRCIDCLFPKSKKCRRDRLRCDYIIATANFQGNA